MAPLLVSFAARETLLPQAAPPAPILYQTRPHLPSPSNIRATAVCSRTANPLPIYVLQLPAACPSSHSPPTTAASCLKEPAETHWHMGPAKCNAPVSRSVPETFRAIRCHAWPAAHRAILGTTNPATTSRRYPQ